MHTELAPRFRNTPQGEEAEEILRRCVHCGFCNATCPTYRLLGDELDGPRGRIYLIKQVLEGKPATERTQTHLDRCLTCRSCETTCPSGVEYGRLIDIGRALVERQVTRPAAERSLRSALREGLTGTWFAPTLRLGQAFRNWLPSSLKASVPEAVDPGAWPVRRHDRRMLLLAGCVQPSLRPSINAATARVFDAAGIEVVIESSAGCCGAIRQHLSDQPGALSEVKRNIDAWWPALQSGHCEALVLNASGCGAMVREYGHLLRADPVYGPRARQVSAAALDVAQALGGSVAQLRARCDSGGTPAPVAFHPPCTLQHGLKLAGVTEKLLEALGAALVPFEESHLCCGSAGTYSILQPGLAKRLRDRKLECIAAAAPGVILSSNIGCITHLQTGTALPVMHWIEWLDRRLSA